MKKASTDTNYHPSNHHYQRPSFSPVTSYPFSSSSSSATPPLSPLSTQSSISSSSSQFSPSHSPAASSHYNRKNFSGSNNNQQTKHELIISPEELNCNPLMANHVGLDCEMVGVGPMGKISVLARVSIVDYYGRLMFDSFVHVEERVTDYRTHVSGVTEQDLKNGADFGLIRKRVKRLCKNKIIVGHGLENDLRALKIEQDHQWYNIRDSASQYQPYMRMDKFGNWRPYRLRDLTWNHLGIVIQQGGKPHDSVEDARAAIALYRNVQPHWDYEIDCCRHRNALASFTQQRQY